MSGTQSDPPRLPPRRAAAVALHYDPAENDLPVVVATGRGAMAERIVDLAFAHDVKVRTDPDLAQLLATAELGSVIPVEAMVAVAEILAYVYRAAGREEPS